MKKMFNECFNRTKALFDIDKNECKYDYDARVFKIVFKNLFAEDDSPCNFVFKEQQLIDYIMVFTLGL